MMKSSDPTDAGCDVVYRCPPRRPYEAMPVGGGDLVAMLRVTDAIDLHLGKCDSWGFRHSDSTRPETELLSPGHVRVYLSPDPTAAESLVDFTQRLSPVRGVVEAIVKTRSGTLAICAWGDVDRNVLVLEIDDGRSDRGAAEVELSHWRSEANCEWRGDITCFVGDGVIGSREEIRRGIPSPSCKPLEPEEEPFQGRAIEIAIRADVPGEGETLCYGQFATLRLRADGPRKYRILIACEVMAKGAAGGKAQATLEAACAVPAAELRRRHDAWWREFWSKSTIQLEGDEQARYLTRLWHLFFYQKAIASRGPYPCQFNGGAGLFERDDRDWLLGVVWQNDREHLWPLDVANHPELSANVWDNYRSILPALRRFTAERWRVEGVVLGERHVWWYNALHGRETQADTNTIGRAGGLGRDEPPGYISHIFSTGAELVQQMLDHARHWGDEAFLRGVVYPWLTGVCEFYANFARKGADGQFHFAPSNANETWWKVQDTLNDLCAVRVCFPEFIALAGRYGNELDRALADRCREILVHLPPLSTGKWRGVQTDGTARIEIDKRLDVYSPAGDPLADTQSHNFEHPELYLVFPWSLAGIGAPDYGRAVRTFAERAFPNFFAWAQCGVQAARLGLRQETANVILDHARRHQKFPYGGWTNCARYPYRLPDGTRLADTSYLDAAGENATAIQEMLLQSYPRRSHLAQGDDGLAPYGSTNGGVIRVCPAVPASWSGQFRLHAMGGFMVAGTFKDGRPTRIEITSELGRECMIANPWPGKVLLTQNSRATALPDSELLRLATVRGETYVLTVHDPV